MRVGRGEGGEQLSKTQLFHRSKVGNQWVAKNGIGTCGMETGMRRNNPPNAYLLGAFSDL